MSPVLPPPALVLVTGVNGLIASHIADQFLAAGYKVRGTARSLERSSWLKSYLDSRHGEGRFELVEVPDIDVKGAYDAALHGVAAVANVAGTADINVSDVDDVTADYLKGVYNLLESAKAQPGIKSVALTSSAWAAYTPQPNVPMTVTEASYNEIAIATAADSSLTAAEKGLAPFMAVRTKAEKAQWEWVRREKPHFAVNTILSDTVLGPILNAKSQPGSTASLVRAIWNAEPTMLPFFDNLAPQWYIDVRDNAKLYVAVMTTGLDGRRIFGFAERYSWLRVSEILKELYPEKTGLPKLPDLGWDQAEVPTMQALEVLKSIGQEEWTPLVRSVRETAESFIHLQD